MFYWMKPLPDCEIDFSEYKPVIENEWFRKHFMSFVYVIQGIILCGSMILGVWKFSNIFIKTLVFIFVFLVHELLHISVIWRIGDISMTHSGIFFWLNSAAKMSKLRFYLFMSLPIWLLTILPTIIAINVQGNLFLYARYIAWINTIIAGSDILNSIVILTKPRNSIFFRGFYKIEHKGGK